MKKGFLEPEIVRIDIKTTENIAASQWVESIYSVGGDGLPYTIMSKYSVDPCYEVLIGADDYKPAMNPNPNGIGHIASELDFVKAYMASCTR